MARYKMIGACPIEVNGEWIQPGHGEFEAELPAKAHAFFTRIRALSVVVPDQKAEDGVKKADSVFRAFTKKEED